MTKLFGFDSTLNKPVLRNVDRLNLVELSTDFPLITPGGRLTLSSTAAVADATNATTIYYLPRVHNLVPLWNSNTSSWVYRSFTSQSVAIGVNAVVDIPFDLYAVLQPDGQLGFTGASWTNATTRSSALQQQHGIFTLNTAQSSVSTYLGTAYLTGSSGAARVQDSPTQRHLFNAHNRISKRLVRTETVGNWTYSGTAWRPWNNSSANRVSVIDGIGNGVLDLSFGARIGPSTAAFGLIGIAFDVTNNATEGLALATSDQTVHSRTSRTVGLGYHYLQAVESAGSGTSVTYYGSGYNGLQGKWWC